MTDDGRSHDRRESPRLKQPTAPQNGKAKAPIPPFRGRPDPYRRLLVDMVDVHRGGCRKHGERLHQCRGLAGDAFGWWPGQARPCCEQPACSCRSEEHTSELQSLMRNSYAVFCLKKKKNK